MLNDIHVTFEKYKDKDYSQDKKNLEELKKKIIEQEKIIEDYLRLKGLSPENIDDAKSASQNIVQLQNERRSTLASLCSIREEIDQSYTESAGGECSRSAGGRVRTGYHHDRDAYHGIREDR